MVPIDQLNPGFLNAELLPLRKLIEKRLLRRGVKVGELGRHIQFLGIGVRPCCSMAFRTIATALIERKGLKLRYHSRGQDKNSVRRASPQRLFYYRGNWYLAAYCLTRQALQTLSVDRMSEVVPFDDPCIEIEEQQLANHYTSSFGIFAGQQGQEVVLVFSPKAARWVAEERWHSKQQGRWLGDGSYELRLPYADETELVMDILRYGPAVLVVSPFKLPEELSSRLELALRQYKK